MLVGNESRVVQLSVTRLFVGAGVAFVTVSQSGIYSTLDYAYEQGMDWNDVVDTLVIPINIEYMKALLAYEDYFDKTVLSATDSIPQAEYYLHSILIFLMYIFLVTLTSGIYTSRTVLRRWHMCGTPLIKVMLTKWAALWFLISVLLAPLFLLYGADMFAVAVLLSGLGLMSAQLFKGEQASGIFLFTFAVVTLFISGGALPLAYLPEVFGRISVFAPNYWFIRIGAGGWVPSAVFCGYGALFFVISYFGTKARCCH
jgi:hypothetical protein